MWGASDAPGASMIGAPPARETCITAPVSVVGRVDHIHREALRDLGRGGERLAAAADGADRRARDPASAAVLRIGPEIFAKAAALVGRRAEAHTVLTELARRTRRARRSAGSGVEPTLMPWFAAELLKALPPPPEELLVPPVPDPSPVVEQLAATTEKSAAPMETHAVG